MWGPPGKRESLERISAALILMDGFQSYQEARGPGAQAEEVRSLHLHSTATAFNSVHILLSPSQDPKS